MKVLVACEFSGVVREAFRKRGHDAWSCDLLDTEIPGNHIKDDVLNYLNEGWDLMIAHPPCTYLCNGSLNWINRQEGRKEKMLDAVSFCKKLYESPIYRIALENPIGKLSTLFRKPDQVLHVNQFGHQFKKDLCLWLKNLPKLKPTKLIDGPLKTYDFWSSKRFTKEGGNRKSITFTGVAEAMAEQWGTPQPLIRGVSE